MRVRAYAPGLWRSNKIRSLEPGWATTPEHSLRSAAEHRSKLSCSTLLFTLMPITIISDQNTSCLSNLLRWADLFLQFSCPRVLQLPYTFCHRISFPSNGLQIGLLITSPAQFAPLVSGGHLFARSPITTSSCRRLMIKAIRPPVISHCANLSWTSSSVLLCQSQSVVNLSLFEAVETNRVNALTVMPLRHANVCRVSPPPQYLLQGLKLYNSREDFSLLITHGRIQKELPIHLRNLFERG